MCLNGILESFHTATATPAEVALQAKWMLASSATFMASLVLLTKTSLGEELARQISYGPTVGIEQVLIAASCLSMIVRILYAFLHARKKVGSALGIKDLVPRGLVNVVIMAAGVILRKAFISRDWRTSWNARLRLLGMGFSATIFTMGIM